MSRPPSQRNLPALLLTLLLLPGCAAFFPEHRLVLNWMDATLAPESTAARVTLAPVALALGVAGYVVDSFLVNPVRFVDEAWDDTVLWAWSWRGSNRDKVPDWQRPILWVAAPILTPMGFVFCWAWRIVFGFGGSDFEQDHAWPEEPAQAGAAP